MSSKQPTSLVKYNDAETAIRTLTNASLRWSAPCLLQDPFELDHHSSLNFDSKALLIACVKKTLGLIFSRDDPSGNSPLIKAVRRWRAEERFDTEDEATEVLTELLASMVRQRDPELSQIRDDWNDFSSKLRILSLNESHENLSLWQNQADGHKGIAVRLACGEDTNFESPMSMVYTETKPEISSLSEQVEILMSQEPVSIQDGFMEKFLCKSKLQSKEREWRLFNNTEHTVDDETQWFEDITFAPSELRAVYFGAGIAETNKQAVLKLLSQKYPRAKQFQAIAKNSRFELDFERLNP
ncbi:MAG: hypothetical protein AB8B95_09675 [Pseudohongiellaceae bacterium]